MELVLRKRLTGDLVRLSGARILCRSSRKLAFVAPYPGQWVFYALVAPGSPLIHYNHQPAPVRCPLEVGDLLDLNGMELVVNSVEVDLRERPVETSDPSPCEIEVPGEGSVRITTDQLIGYDPSGGFCLAATLDQQPLTALLTSATGRWHLHDLNGNSLIRNGKASGSSLLLANGDRVRIQNKEILFHIGRPSAAAAALVSKPQVSADEIRKPLARGRQKEVIAPSPSQEIAFVHRKAKNLCQRLLPVLRDPCRTLRPEQASSVGIRGWLRLLRRPISPAETLDRLDFLLSHSPRNRVWLFELCRFLYQQSYVVLSLRVARSLCRLYPLDGELMQTLAKLYYQQGCNLHLSALERLNAFEAAEKCTGLARRLMPDAPVLADLQRAVRAEQKVLRGKLATMPSCEALRKENVDAMEGLG